MRSSDRNAAPVPQGQFAPTRWTIVLAARGQSDTQAERALADLCCNYWYPLYAFVRRSGYSAQDAQDLTQEFFAKLLEKKYLEQADPRRGRFRTFLLTMLQHFLINEWNRAQARKRGGGRAAIPIDALDAEARYGREPVDEQSPEKLFERQWALTVLNQALERLRAEYAASGKGELFAALVDVLHGQATCSHADMARKLNTTEGAVGVAFHRLRRRYRALLRQQIAETVASPAEVDGEIKDLLKYL
jgi:RNA polymerase sigma-70 factor (ECF subfamily)